MGGLNYQIEHHLFPSMPRPNLRRAQADHQAVLHRQLGHLHRDHAAPKSYAIVVRYLNMVGLRGGDPFTCPLVATMRPRI